MTRLTENELHALLLAQRRMTGNHHELLMQQAQAARDEALRRMFVRAVRGLARLSGLALLLRAARRGRDRRRTQTQLARLDDRLLRDIGLERADIAAVTAVPGRRRQDDRTVAAAAASARQGSDRAIIAALPLPGALPSHHAGPRNAANGDGTPARAA